MLNFSALVHVLPSSRRDGLFGRFVVEVAVLLHRQQLVETGVTCDIQDSSFFRTLLCCGFTPGTQRRMIHGAYFNRSAWLIFCEHSNMLKPIGSSELSALLTSLPRRLPVSLGNGGGQVCDMWQLFWGRERPRVGSGGKEDAWVMRELEGFFVHRVSSAKPAPIYQ